jgi:hypothetical protein
MVGHLAIDLDPALGNPVVGLAARAQAQLGHALVQAQHTHAAVLHTDGALRLQRHQRFVDPLARQPHQVSQLLLGDAQHLAHAGVQHRVEQRRQAARHAHVGVVEAVDLARGNELPSRSLSWFITKRLKPMEWSSSQ